MGTSSSKKSTNINKQMKQKPHFSEDKKISHGGKQEEDMINKFNAFDILWYASDSDDKLENWKAFTNVDVFKISEENEFIDIVENNRKLYYIIISTGSFAEKTIPKLNKNIIPPNVIIYCCNAEYHKKWSKKYQFVVEVFTQPFQIFEYLLRLQNNVYDIPVFSYNLNYGKEFNFSCYDKKENIKIKENQNNCSLKWNKYEKFCVNILHDFRLASMNEDEYFENFFKNSSNIIDLFYGKDLNMNNFPEIVDFFSNNIYFNKPASNLLNFFICLTLVSLYFSKFPYLFGALNYVEIETFLKEKLSVREIIEDYKELYHSHLNILTSKLLIEKVSLLEETIHLKFLHTFLIKFLKWVIKDIYKFEFDEYSKYPIMINCLMDLDFCIKLFFFRIYGYFKCIEYKIKCRAAIEEIDKRILVFNGIYLSKHYYEEDALKKFSYEKLNTLNESLIIKDFIIIGKKNFHKKIKNIESYFSHNELSYLSIDEVRKYLNTKKKTDKYRNFIYFIIIKAKEVEKIYNELLIIKLDFGLNLFLIVYLKDSKTLINKVPFLNSVFMPIYIVYNTNDIINFINCQKNLSSAYNFYEQSKIILNTLNKIKFLKNWNDNKNDNVDRISSEDGWELVDYLPKEIFKNKILGQIGNMWGLLDKIKINMYNIYKENNIEQLFFRTYCKYFFYQIIPEFCFFQINNIVKQFCYAYTLDEGKNSFYYIMNKDLRSGDPSKIEKYLDIISIINSSVENGFIKSFEGELFRGTKIEEDFIEKKIVEGKVLTNLSFWSASKSREIAEKFLTGKNILFLINTKKKNIDIDLEHISKYEKEKEVLFLPYSKFLIKSKKKKKFKNTDIFEVKLEGLDDEDERGNISSIPLSKEEMYTIFNNID